MSGVVLLSPVEFGVSSASGTRSIAKLVCVSQPPKANGRQGGKRTIEGSARDNEEEVGEEEEEEQEEEEAENEFTNSPKRQPTSTAPSCLPT